MCLTEVVIDRIRREGPISFHDFMEMALYHPDQGYYTSTREKLGKAGDFYTSPYLGALFGEMIAGQLEEMWQLLDRKPFTIIEQGAGTGLLCRDILHRLQLNSEMYRHLNYIIIEKSRPRSPLPEKLEWRDSIEGLGPVTGCIFSNELLDNFAVHQVIMQGELMEVFVDYQDGFVEILRPAAPVLTEYFRQLRVDLPRGYRTEVNLEAIDWIRTISEKLKRGFVMTIDYGYPSSDLYSHSKSSGTLVCYHRHQINHSPYERVGEQDITTHVNFSALDHWGRNNGLDYCGYTNQTFFLQGLGLARYLRNLEENGQYKSAVEQEKFLIIRTLLMEMGNRFKVLIQKKGIRQAWLSGLQFPQRLT
ncbi:MAG TPA: SAM-dependent methyltransferase [Puia sp.]|nr:SAM-dependent methyltransferase [Puia sp.]